MTDEVTPESGGGLLLTKTCPKCGETKAHEEFGKRKRSADGLQGYCRGCNREYNRGYTARNPDKIASYVRGYRERNPERHMVFGARERAQKQGIPFALTEADIVIPTHCPVLGLELARSEGKAGPASPSLDKIIPALGYTPGNIQVISNRANILKRDATLEELEALTDWMRRQVAPAPTSRRRAAP